MGEHGTDNENNCQKAFAKSRKNLLSDIRRLTANMKNFTCKEIKDKLI